MPERTTAKRRTTISREISVKLSLNKVLWPELAVVALLIAALFIWRPALHKAPRILPGERPSIAALDSICRTRLWIAWEWRDYDRFIKTAKGRLAAIEKLRPASMPPAEAEVWTRGIEHLRAAIFLAEGRPDEARPAFEKIQRRPVSILQPIVLVQRIMPYLHDIPGRAQAMKGRKDLAVSLYERFVSSNPRDREMEILHPFSRLELAKLYESSGERGKALAQLERLAELWKNADQGLAQVEEARQRLAALRGSKD